MNDWAEAALYVLIRLAGVVTVSPSRLCVSSRDISPRGFSRGLTLRRAHRPPGPWAEHEPGRGETREKTGTAQGSSAVPKSHFYFFFFLAIEPRVTKSDYRDSSLNLSRVNTHLQWGKCI